MSVRKDYGTLPFDILLRRRNQEGKPLKTKIFVLMLLIVVAIVPLVAQTRGVVVTSATGKAVVFDADTDTVTGSVAIGAPGGSSGDCSITLNQAFAFVTNFTGNVVAVQLSPPALAGPPNPIPISNHGEDTSLSPNGNHLVVCDGSDTQPISVIDVASRVQLSAVGSGSPDCNSVDVSNTGSVLVTSANTGVVRRLTIDAFGGDKHR